MRLEDFDTLERYAATVQSSERITPDDADDEVRDIVLTLDRDYHYRVGQCLGVVVPAASGFGHGEHFRLYAIANTPGETPDGKPRVVICVKRCRYVDEYSGELYDGVASNYLCDLTSGDTVTVTGAVGQPFEVPEDKEANLLLIGLGTGIAPFRALVRHIYEDVPEWNGKVRLFYGGRTGLEMYYMNDHRDDFTNYYDEETFKAFKALSPRPHWDEPVALDDALREHAAEVWEMVMLPHTYVYVAGLKPIREMLDRAFEDMAGSKEAWERRRAEMVAGKRWVELLY